VSIKASQFTLVVQRRFRQSHFRVVPDRLGRLVLTSGCGFTLYGIGTLGSRPLPCFKMAHPVFQYVLPSLLIGAALGHYAPPHFSGSLQDQKADKMRVSPRERFLSSTQEEVDYDKLARVCLTAGQRGQQRTSARSSITAEPDSPEVNDVKEKLDSVMSVSLEEGFWSRGAAFRARTLLRRLPASDVANFESLLRTTLERGDMQAQPGAWVPALID
jgi:hypothetical protein